MKVKDLMRELRNVDGELDVYVYADHGQDTMNASTFGVRYCYKDEVGNYSLEESYSEKDLLEEGEDVSDYGAFVEIGAP